MNCTDSGPATGSLDDALKGIMLEKAQRAGFYRAAALQAEKSGYAEVATYLGEIAEEERTHLSKLSQLEAVVDKDTRKNIGALIKKEKQASGSDMEALVAMSNEEGNAALATLLAQIQADDQRHSLGLKGILERVK
jgi:rubrerythrin